MPTSLQVEKQCFKFGDSWTVAFKYDDTSCYRNGPERLKGEVDGVPQSTRALDAVGLHERAGLLMLEAKDFREHRIENKPRIKDGEIVVEVALKTRDTVAGLLGAARTGENGFDSDALFAALKKGSDVTVVLWLEDDAQRDNLQAKQQLGTLTQSLKTKLKWLNVKAFALSSKVPNLLPDLTVTNLPGAGQPNP